MARMLVLVATRKGAWLFHGDPARRSWPGPRRGSPRSPRPRADLDRQFPGIRFRVVDEQERPRPHVRFFVNGRQVSDLERPLLPTDELVIVPALSGG